MKRQDARIARGGCGREAAEEGRAGERSRHAHPHAHALPRRGRGDGRFVALRTSRLVRPVAARNFASHPSSAGALRGGLAAWTGDDGRSLPVAVPQRFRTATGDTVGASARAALGGRRDGSAPAGAAPDVGLARLEASDERGEAGGAVAAGAIEAVLVGVVRAMKTAVLSLPWADGAIEHFYRHGNDSAHVNDFVKVSGRAQPSRTGTQRRGGQERN